MIIRVGCGASAALSNRITRMSANAARRAPETGKLSSCKERRTTAYQGLGTGQCSRVFL